MAAVACRACVSSECGTGRLAMAGGRSDGCSGFGGLGLVGLRESFGLPLGAGVLCLGVGMGWRSERWEESCNERAFRGGGEAMAVRE